MTLERDKLDELHGLIKELDLYLKHKTSKNLGFLRKRGHAWDEAKIKIVEGLKNEVLNLETNANQRGIDTQVNLNLLKLLVAARFQSLYINIRHDQPSTSLDPILDSAIKNITKSEIENDPDIINKIRDHIYFEQALLTWTFLLDLREEITNEELKSELTTLLTSLSGLINKQENAILSAHQRSYQSVDEQVTGEFDHNTAEIRAEVTQLALNLSKEEKKVSGKPFKSFLNAKDQISKLRDKLDMSMDHISENVKTTQLKKPFS